MKVILIKDVYGLGYKDEVLTVKDGYGRNYLLPQRLAVLATDKALKQLEESNRQRAHKIAKIKADAEARAALFQGVEVTIEAKTSVEGTIYGSVGAAQIAQALKDKGLEIDHRLINTKNVKSVGSYVALLQFHRDITVELPFHVVSDQPIETPKKEEKPAEAPAQEEDIDAMLEDARGENEAE